MNTCLIFILIVQSLYAISSAKNVRPQLCTLPKKTGPCRAMIRRYYYDARQGECLLFTYGGCRGNRNRFKTLQGCEKTCKGKKCEKPCFKSYRPVCGSDRKTYSNECVMEVADCKSDKDIKKVHDGPCKPKCPNLCTMEFNPQCGSDGVTYSNPCSLGVAKCKSNGQITLAHKGKCGKKCDKPCSRIYHPVCGSDGKTYPNECVLEVADCKSEEDIKKVHDGRCKPKCPMACTMEYNPQCGSDGVTYSNPCSLGIAKCKSNGKITLAHEGKCDVCALKRYPGPCKASFQRYYYNSSSRKCELFIYGGCHGNGNNFATLVECQKSCDVCSLKPDPGICYAYIPRYFYNSTSKACERFIYGGCGGNKNNFKTIQDCQAKCQ